MQNHPAAISKKNFFILASLFLPALLTAQTAIDRYNPYLQESNQVLFVSSPGWKATQATMHLYQRADKSKPWKLIQKFPVTLGRSGLAPDRKSPLPKPAAIAEKKEGDGKSPAGIFSLGPVFSYHDILGLKMPFKRVDTSDICVDDAHSVYYNTLINTDTASQKDWNSFEHMKMKTDDYEYGVWVKYNSDNIFSGAGSCIFLHVWSGGSSPTSGCTAMDKHNILILIHWLDEKQNPVLLQLAAK